MACLERKCVTALATGEGEIENTRCSEGVVAAAAIKGCLADGVVGRPGFAATWFGFKKIKGFPLF